jgi:hypothetical protein
MKQYRHKATQILLERHPVLNYYNGKESPWQGANIPASIVENSTEYAPAEHLFITEDGVKIYEGMRWWYVPIRANTNMHQTTSILYKGDSNKMKPVKRFFDLANARKFADTLNSQSITLFELEEKAKEFKFSKTSLELIKAYLTK